MADRFVLLVDGPGAGELVPDPGHVAIEYPAAPGAVTFDLYHVHKLALFGRVVRVGSTQDDAHNLDPDDLWQALIAPVARAASRDAWCPWGAACPTDLGDRHRVTRACLDRAEAKAREVTG